MAVVYDRNEDTKDYEDYSRGEDIDLTPLTQVRLKLGLEISSLVNIIKMMIRRLMMLMTAMTMTMTMTDGDDGDTDGEDLLG